MLWLKTTLNRNCSEWPRVATTLVALLLSLLWTGVWIIAFFICTWVLDVETKASVLVFTFWIGVAAESIIRWAENTDLVAILSKPKLNFPKGDNQDFRFDRAWRLVIWQVVVVGGYMFLETRIGDVFSIDPELKFTGQNGVATLEVFREMVHNWMVVMSDPRVTMPIFVGALFCASIYKRAA